MRKLIAFDDDTFDKLKQLAQDRMGTFQELADEAFADLLKKHGIPIDLKDALRKSARLAQEPNKNGKRPKAPRKSACRCSRSVSVRNPTWRLRRRRSRHPLAR